MGSIMNNDFYNVIKNECEKIVGVSAGSIYSRLDAWNVFYTIAQNDPEGPLRFLKRFKVDDDQIRITMQSVFRNVDWA